jgi:lipopolysaccharide export system protein LptA
MPLPIYRLRRLLAATTVVLVVVVAGMYFYARSRARNVLKEIPHKLGYEIKQTVNGFQISKSDGKRTLFTVQASDVKEFKLNGRAELHNVNIVLYGRDSSRFDQIYGDDFAYDQKTGDVTARGEVQIDLVANPTGLTSPDQTTPKELKNPIHLKTRDLVFNKDTGDAWTDARVEFRTPQASGWAMGVKYAGKTSTLTLASQVHVVLSGAYEGTLEAEHGVITNDPREVVLDHPHLRREDGMMQSDHAVFYLGSDNNVERILADGNFISETRGKTKEGRAKEGRAKDEPAKEESKTDASAKQSAQPPPASEIHTRADQAEFLLTSKQNRLRTTTLTGNVHIEQDGPQPAEGNAGRMIMEFGGQNQLQTVHALDGARLTQKASGAKAPGSTSSPQDFELTAPVIDFTVAQGHILQRAVTSGAAQITITSAQAAPAASTSTQAATPEAASTQPASTQQRTVVTAGKFDAKFASSDGGNRLASVHGAPDARIVSSAAGQPDRVSTSDAVDAVFMPQGGIESITQQGNVAYTDGQTPDKRVQAWANNARYTPADQLLVLTGSPRVVSGSMATTAKTIHINRATGDALAETDVKSTYSELKEQPDGALLASSSPIHVTARSMVAHNSSHIALYSGKARLWQDANIIEAPSIQFDRDRRFVTAQGTAAQPVQTILVQTEKSKAEPGTAGAAVPQSEAKKSTPVVAANVAVKRKDGTSPASDGASPITITATQLTYADSERRVHYDGGVIAKGADFTASAKTADAYLLPRSQTLPASPAQPHNNQSVAAPGQLDHMVAQGDVLVEQPNRRATGQNLVYTAADDKFVLTGGPPSIFDAEQGKITGVSLTFFRRDDRVLVEGEASTPVVTQTRVAK